MKTYRANSKFAFRQKAIGLVVASCFVAHPAAANPTNPTVVSGSASMSSSGSTLTITNTPGAIINWQSFGIGAGEAVRFIQQSAASSVLNRVTGGNPSQILGTLQSNGRVFLINPAGIMFGQGSVVDVAGLVASTLNMTDDDFLAGRMRFNADTAAPGAVVNAGEIKTSNGGFVYLLAPSVENSGVVNTPSGEAILAAGHSVELVSSTDPALRVVVSAQSQDVNLSQLMTENNGNVFSVLNSGKISANTAVQDQTGKIYFKSAGNIQTTALSVTEARGDAAVNGGSIIAFADQQGLYAGAFNASGKNGGFIETSGHYLNVDGISINAGALSATGQGGTWLLDPYDFVINGAGATAISTTLSAGTDVIVDTSLPSYLGYGGTPGLGDITVDAVLTHNGTSGSHLYLYADHDIIFTVNGGITNTNTGPLAVNMDAANNITLGPINIQGGLYATAMGDMTVVGALNSPEMWLNAGGNILANGAITAAGNSFHPYAKVGMWAGSNVTINGAITATSALGGADIWVNALGNIDINSVMSSNSTAPTSSAYGSDAFLEAWAGNTLTLNNSLSSSSQYGSSHIHAGGEINAFLTAASALTATASAGEASVEVFGDNGTLDIDNSTISASGLLEGDVLLVGQNVQIRNGTTVTGDYVGVNYEPDYIQTNTDDFFSFIGTATTNIDSSTITANYGFGFGGYDVTFTNSTMSTASTTVDGVHGIVMNDLKLDGSTLSAGYAMLLETGGHLYLDNNSSVSAGSMMDFNFPLLASDGWYVDGLASAFGGPNGSSITVGGNAPIEGVNFFVTYGGFGDVISQIVGEQEGAVEVDDTFSELLADGPTAEDFFGEAESENGTSNGSGIDGNGDEEEKKKEKKKDDKPQECS